MEQLGVNQIYNKSGSDLSFKEWLNNEQLVYNKKIEQSGFARPICFKDWLNKKYMMIWRNKEVNQNADAGSILKNIADISGNVKEIVTGKQKPSPELAAQEKESQLAALDKRILGLKPIAFYAISAIVIAGIVFAGWKIYKSVRK